MNTYYMNINLIFILLVLPTLYATEGSYSPLNYSDLKDSRRYRMLSIAPQAIKNNRLKKYSLSSRGTPNHYRINRPKIACALLAGADPNSEFKDADKLTLHRGAFQGAFYNNDLSLAQLYFEKGLHKDHLLKTDFENIWSCCKDKKSLYLLLKNGVPVFKEVQPIPEGKKIQISALDVALTQWNSLEYLQSLLKLYPALMTHRNQHLLRVSYREDWQLKNPRKKFFELFIDYGSDLDTANDAITYLRKNKQKDLADWLIWYYWFGSRAKFAILGLRKHLPDELISHILKLTNYSENMNESFTLASQEIHFKID